MLRIFVLILVLLNAGYFAWSEGYFRAWGFAPVQQSEPQRLAQQIRPENIRVATPEETRRIELAAKIPNKPPECLQVGPFEVLQWSELRPKLEAALPAGSWQQVEVSEPARWIVYVGKFTSDDAMAKKRAELASLNLKFESINNPALQPGLSLGGFDSRVVAEAALTQLSKRGVRTAKVVQERTELVGSLLRVAAADDNLRTKLEDLQTELADKPLRSCK